jgi:hypothetical protein
MTRTASAPGPHSRGGVRFLLAAATVLVTVALQAVFVALAPALPLSVAGVALAALSGLVILAATVAFWRLAAHRPGADAAADVHEQGWGRLVALVGGTGVVVLITATVFPPGVPVIVAIGCPIVATGGFGGARRLVRRHPARVVLLVLITVLAAVLVWIAALLAGLFITGWVAAALTWLAAGAVAAILVHAWSRLASR